MQGGLEVCITVTLLDGLVLARSGFHHDMLFRSVMAFGTAEPVTDEAEKERVLGALVDHIIPGRNAQVLPSPNDCPADCPVSFRSCSGWLQLELPKLLGQSSSCHVIVCLSLYEVDCVMSLGLD